MSFNQSRGDKNEPSQYRRSGRSGNPASQRNFSGGGGGGKGGAGGGSTTAPPSSSFYSGKSFKKVVTNAQGAQTRVIAPNVNSDSSNSSTTAIAVQNGAHVQPPLRGSPDASPTGATVKQTDASVHKSNPGLPKAPQGTAVTPSSGTAGAAAPATPAKGSADASRAFPLQFGSISPGVMNGMQVPARTNSAPPNLDEQKRAQACLDSLKATSFSNPADPKQQPPPRKDTGVVDQSNSSEAQPTQKDKKEVPTSAAPTATHTQKPSGPPMPPISRVSMQMPFYQSQLHLQFGGRNPAMQSQGMANMSLSMPHQMHLPVGNPPQVQQQVFVPGIQHQPMSSQGIMHQSQGLNFSSQMGPPHMGMGLGPQYPQQQMGNFGGTRRTVKITHPDTHEELRLDKKTDAYANSGLPGPRSHPHGPPQSQAVLSFPPTHPMNYYPNSYNASPLFFPPSSSNPLASAQPTSGSQAPRVYNQVTVKPAASAHGEKVGNSSLAGSSSSMDKSEIPTHPHVGSESMTGSSLSQSSMAASSKPSVAAFGSFQSESLANNSSSSASDPVEDSALLANSMPGFAEKAVSRSGSFKEEQKQPGKKSQSMPVNQHGGESSSVLRSSVGQHSSLDSGVRETSKSSTASVGTNEDVVEATTEAVPTTVDVSGGSSLKFDASEGGLDPTKMMGPGTGSDSSPKVEGLKAEVVASKERGNDSVDQNDDRAALDITAGNETSVVVTPHAQRQEPVNNIDGLGSSHGDKIACLDDCSNRIHGDDADHVDSGESVALDDELHDVSASSSGSINRTMLEASKAKGNMVKGKKKRKEILKNADAQGMISDLYMAYKHPEEKKEASSAETVEGSSSITPKQASVNSSEKDDTSDEKGGHGKFEPDDWEDAADISTPELEASDNRKQVHVGLKPYSEEGNDGMKKKYSRDFLLKFRDHFTDLPEGFEITADMSEAMIVSNVNVHRESYPSPGRAVDRSVVGSRLERRQSNVGDDDKWSKVLGPMGPGRDTRVDMGYAGNMASFRPDVLRNLRGPMPGPYAGGILAGPMQSPGAPGGTQRNNSDSDRWQRATAYQKGLIPSPQTPMPVMHKAERKYEVGKITDEEQAKQRQLKGILNKLTPQNFEKLFEQVKQVNIDNAGTLSGVISQIFDKALMEPTFCEMYANFCSRLAVELPDFSEDNEKITFKRLLLNKCQEEFERGEKEEEEANRTEEEGEAKQSEEEREEKRVKARRRMLGNIRLIGELYKKKMLTERIMHECIKKLLGQYQNPDEEDIEALCKLMSTIGEMIDHPKAKEHMDVYFDMMAKLSNNMKLSSRVRFMLKDVIDLRKNKWQQRRKVEGPKKIEEVHRDAAQERQAQSSRLARGPSPNVSGRRGQPMEFGPKGSNVLPSPNTQMGGFRGLPPQQLRGYGHQDVRFEERHSFENRTLSVPLRPIGDDSITLGPQGGLARGMSIRGQPSVQGIPLHEMPNPTDPRRVVATGPNGYGTIPERFGPSTAYGHSSMQDPDTRRALRSSPPRGRALTPTQSVPSDKVLSEDRLRDTSIETIKEFYSAKDEKEVALCIKDLNAPSFYPTMISIWVTDSFERKDMERDALTKLLINLAKSHDGMLSEHSLVRGFESVLSTLEDAVNDAPRAAEFLGRMFARILLENVIPYKEVWHMIHEGGEEQGRLVEIGLAAEVLGVILEIIKSEKGDAFLNDLRAGSTPRLEHFRPNTKKTLRLDKFI